MRLEKIIELKLVFGLAAAPQRLFDLGLVQKVIEHLNLPLDLAEKLDPSVRDTYIEYCTAIRTRPARTASNPYRSKSSKCVSARKS